MASSNRVCLGIETVCSELYELSLNILLLSGAIYLHKMVLSALTVKTKSNYQLTLKNLEDFMSLID